MFNLENIGYTNLTNLIVCFISLLGGFFTSKIINKKPYKIDILQKQLTFVYSPLFHKIEQNLYKSIDKQTAESYIAFFNSLKNQYYDLIDCNTLLYFSRFEKKYRLNNYISVDDFFDFCYSVDRHFEKIRKNLGLPTRNFLYRWSNNQYRLVKKILVMDISISFLRLMIVLTLTIFIYATIQLTSDCIVSLIK